MEGSPRLPSACLEPLFKGSCCSARRSQQRAAARCARHQVPAPCASQVTSLCAVLRLPACRPPADQLLLRWHNERLRLDRLRLQLEQLQARLHLLEKQGAAEEQQEPPQQQRDEEAGVAVPVGKGAAPGGGKPAAGSAVRRWCACGAPLTAEQRQEKAARLEKQRVTKEEEIADAERMLADLQVGAGLSLLHALAAAAACWNALRAWEMPQRSAHLSQCLKAC